MSIDENIDMQTAQDALDTTTEMINDIQEKEDRYRDVNLFIELMYKRHPSVLSGLTPIDQTVHISWLRTHGTPFIDCIRENMATRFPKDRLLSCFSKVTHTHTHTLTHTHTHTRIHTYLFPCLRVGSPSSSLSCRYPS